MDSLDNRLKRAESNYKRLSKACTAAVVRWEWYSAAAFNLKPLHFERTFELSDLIPKRSKGAIFGPISIEPQQTLRGKLLARRPKSIKGMTLYGFDEQDRVVVSRHFTSNAGTASRFCQEEFFEYEGDTTLATFYNDQIKNILNVSQLTQRAGKPVKCEMLSASTSEVELYRYTGQRLTGIDSVTRPLYNPVVLCTKSLIKYDKAGAVRTITEYGSGVRRGEVVYRG